MAKTYIYGANAWGGYYPSTNDLVINVNSLTQESTLSLYLYGALSRPDNPADYIRSVNSKAIVLDMDSK